MTVWENSTERLKLGKFQWEVKQKNLADSSCFYCSGKDTARVPMKKCFFCIYKMFKQLLLYIASFNGIPLMYRHLLDC